MLNIVPFNMGHGNFVVIAGLLLPSLFLNYEHFMTCCANHVMDMQVLYLTFQINQPTRCNNFSSLLLDVYVQLNTFQASSRPSSGTQQLQ